MNIFHHHRYWQNDVNPFCWYPEHLCAPDNFISYHHKLPLIITTDWRGRNKPVVWHPHPLQKVLGALAKLSKATISFVTFARQHETTQLPLTDFHKIWYFRFFLIYFREIQVSVKSDKNSGFLIRRPVFIYDSTTKKILKMRNTSDKICRETQNTHFKFDNFFPKIVPFMR